MDSWTDLQQHLRTELLRLPDSGFVIASATGLPPRPTKVRHARFLGLVQPKYELHQPFVQFIRMEDHLMGECIGAERFGGLYPFSEAEHDGLLSLGWHVPHAAESRQYRRYWPDDVPQHPYLPEVEAQAASGLAILTLRDVIGCESPDSVQVEAHHTGKS
jgi:hypothetical protein